MFFENFEFVEMSFGSVAEYPVFNETSSKVKDILLCFINSKKALFGSGFLLFITIFLFNKFSMSEMADAGETHS